MKTENKIEENFKVVVDYGKPYEEEFKTKEEVLNYLEELYYEVIDIYGCIEDIDVNIIVLKGDEDITEYIFEEYHNIKKSYEDFNKLNEINNNGISHNREIRNKENEIRTF